MKIGEFAAQVTKLEGGKKQLDIAQVSEVLKIVNAELWGIPYALIRIKGRVRIGAFLCLAVLLFVSGCAAYFHRSPRVPEAHTESKIPADGCQGNHPPVAVIEVSQ